MIIDCICGKKKFRVPDEQMPREGRKVQCAACSQIWFYQPPIREELEEQEIETIAVSSNKLNYEKKEEPVKKLDNTKSKAYQLDKDTIVAVAKTKLSRFSNTSRIIYLVVLVLFSLSIILSAFKDKVIMAYPFLKIYLSVVKILILKFLKLLGLS